MQTGDLNFWIGVATLVAIWGVFGLGLQLNAGLTGLINFGQAGIMAVGAYTMAILVVKGHQSLWVALFCSAVLAIVCSVAMGVVTGRLRKDYFAIASLAIAQLAVAIAQNARDLTGGGQGIFGFDGDWYELSTSMTDTFGPIGGQDRPLLPLMLVGWVLLVGAALVLGILKRAGWGRVLRAIREDEDAAAALGKNVLRFKLQSLAISGFLGAVSGWLLAMSLGILAPTQFDATYTFLGYAALIIGGLASFRGAIVGTAILWVILEGSRLLDLPLDSSQLAALRYLLVGLVLMLFVGFRPQGLFGNREELHLER